MDASMLGLIAAPPVVLFLLSHALDAAFGRRFGARWWWLRIGLVPALSSAAALSILVWPSGIPDDYDPARDANSGRLDFVAMLVWGLAVPALYAALAVPVTTIYAFFRRNR